MQSIYVSARCSRVYAAFTTVLDGGSAVMLPGGTASFTTISAGGADIVSGGIAYSTTVSDGGAQIVSGGIATSAAISGGTGLLTESFLDMRDGSNYANRSGPVRLYPDFPARMWEAFGCAPLIVMGPELLAARSLVARYALDLAAA